VAPFTVIAANTEGIAKFMSFTLTIINYICTISRHYASTMHFTSDDYDEFVQTQLPPFLDQPHWTRTITFAIVSSIVFWSVHFLRRSKEPG
jgi:hypothetical protein